MNEYSRHNQKEFTPRKIFVRLLFIVYHVIALYYLVWLLRHINKENLNIFIPFYIAEIICLISLSLSILIIWRRRFNRSRPMTDFKDAPDIDIFLTVCGEPVEIVRETIKSAAEIRYPHKRVYILDDGASSEVRDAAAEFSCRYLSRPVKEDRKAGNLNYGLEHSTGKFILTLDADQVADPDILERMMGYFKLSHVAFVQSAQNFCVSENDPFGNRETVFYQVEQTGKDAFNSAFSCGSAVIYRRSALEDIGGFSTWNLVEDVHTSLLLHDRGWRSVYVDQSFSKGTAPEEIWSFYRQRQQWCTDSVRMLLWDNPIFRKGLTRFQKLQYFTTGFQYLVGGLVLPIFYFLPSWSLFTGKFLINDPGRDYLTLRFILLCLSYFMYSVAHYPQHTAKSIRMWCGQFPNFIYAIVLAALSPKSKPHYKVTPKVKFDKVRFPFVAVLPQLGVMAINLGAVAYAAIYKTCSFYIFMVNVFWVIWICWLMSQICYAALFSHRPGPLKLLQMLKERRFGLTSFL